MGKQPTSRMLRASEPCLQVYLLGSVDFEAALGLQRKLLYEIAGERERAALIVCEHPPIITVGRQGSRVHIQYEPEELKARRWPVRWVNRGGGCVLHVPGQFAIYPILALDHLEMGVQAYQEELAGLLTKLLRDFSVQGEIRLRQSALWVGKRPIASLGVAVRHWVTYYGAVLNVNPDLELLRHVRTGGTAARPMTSLERERHGRLRPALVR